MYELHAVHDLQAVNVLPAVHLLNVCKHLDCMPAYAVLSTSIDVVILTAELKLGRCQRGHCQQGHNDC